MHTTSLGVTSVSCISIGLSLAFKNLKNPFSSFSRISHRYPEIFASLSSSPPHGSALCRASQVADFFPTESPEIVVREARLEDSWEVAETHCSSFFPKYSFPYDYLLRINRAVGMLFGFSIPSGCNRTCLVAVIGSSDQDALFLGSDDFKIGGFDGRFSLNKGRVAGILTVDTIADFLPRKGPLQQRRTGIAYISNVAVQERFRRKGIAKRLIAKAEAKARSWGCHAIALHSDLNEPRVTKLYKGQGFKCIKVPEGANWPRPRSSRDVQFNFMMKLLNPPIKSQIV
ncbi:Acyl-CoA N-acyltransferase (NAT) superfamily protein [Forsythia ovata]|uniref:Acyl-CoA N-acyltransferase (NAT) superfamily protein n=1 Tax=Forsythia ovata TaxID=205694 RepID=A0ABD1R1P6_9LAMI